ncbi:MAG: carboxypeptidase regulatory-like domain-containing protein [Bacteroidetes bacterium]|nr:carboxypeptidase regulatory-like domain-containing protein [Bacteroidota bacterium]
MRNTGKTILSYFGSLIITGIQLFSTQTAYAQHCKFFEISYKDSLIASNEKNILFNNIKIKNPSQKTMRLGITIKIPKGWKLLSKDELLTGKEVISNFTPGMVKNIPLNLLKQPKTAASWDSVLIDIRVLDVVHSHPYAYHLRAEADPKFSAQYITEDMELAARPEVVPLSFRIKNTGNIEDVYTIQWQNQYLGLNEKQQLKLYPGEDTVYTYSLKIPPALWQEFRHENIALCINGSNHNSYTHVYRLRKPRHIIKETRSAYPSLPITIEGGLINQSNALNYYGAIRGDIHLANNDNLNFYYKSKQFGNEVYGIQQNMYLINYQHASWKFSVGMIQSLQRFFLSNGRGFSITHTLNDHTEISIAAILKDPNFYYTSNNYTANARYKIGGFNISQILSTNFDDVNHLNGYVLSNSVQLVNTKEMNFSVQAGTGIQEKTHNVPGVNKMSAGLTGGYKFMYKLGDWNVNSNIEYYDRNFPGINNGMMMQMHQITREFKKKFAGIFYSSSALNTRYYTDTLYNTDILKYNTQRYGLNTGFRDKRNSLMLNTGVMNEDGIGSESELNKMGFLDINYSFQSGKATNILLTSQNAFKNNVGVDKENVLITSTMASINIGWPGVMFSYTRRPIFSYENHEQKISSYDETMAGGPFIKYNLFRGKLNGLLKYQFSKSVYDEVVRTSIIGSINYTNDKIGTSLQISGNMPTNKAVTSGQLPVSEGKFLTVSLIKQLNIPIITHRLFYDMKLILFNDLNNNNKKDDNEEALSDMPININNTELLKTNKHGIAKYENIPKGTYALELSTIQDKGLVPANGLMQSVYVGDNKPIYVPYKKGRSLKGNVTVIRDSFSRTVFTADEIKIIVTDSAGRNYSTVTNQDGNFTFSLPAGIYTVSLNPDAFEGSDFIPVKMAFNIDLYKHEEEQVSFTIKQKTRKVRFLEQK